MYSWEAASASLGEDLNVSYEVSYRYLKANEKIGRKYALKK